MHAPAPRTPGSARFYGTLGVALTGTTGALLGIALTFAVIAPAIGRDASRPLHRLGLGWLADPPPAQEAPQRTEADPEPLHPPQTAPGQQDTSAPAEDAPRPVSGEETA